MAKKINIRCDEMDRRQELQSNVTLNGIDYIEIVTQPQEDNQYLLEVHFIENMASSLKKGIL